MVGIKRRREEEKSGVATEFVLRGTTVEAKNIVRYEQRKKKRGNAVASNSSGSSCEYCRLEHVEMLVTSNGSSFAG